MEVHCDQLGPEALLRSLKAGRYYSTQGDQRCASCFWMATGYALRAVKRTRTRCPGVADRWQSAQERTSEGGEEPIWGAEFDLAPFGGSYCSVMVVDLAGRRAWSNPIWP